MFDLSKLGRASLSRRSYSFVNFLTSAGFKRNSKQATDFDMSSLVPFVQRPFPFSFLVVLSEPILVLYPHCLATLRRTWCSSLFKSSNNKACRRQSSWMCITSYVKLDLLVQDIHARRSAIFGSIWSKKWEVIMGISGLVRCQHLINYHKNVGNALVTFKWKVTTGYDFNVPPVAIDMTSCTSLQFVPLNHRTAVQIHTPSKVLHCLPLRLLALSRLHVWHPTNHKLGLWGEVQAVRGS